MNILVTNDDGVSAPGLLALARAMRLLGNVNILAPDRNWSGSGHVKTLDRPLRVKEVHLEDGGDIGALFEGYVSINPLQLDLTAYPVLQILNSWKLAL